MTKKIAIIVQCTGAYLGLIPALTRSIDRYLVPGASKIILAFNETTDNLKEESLEQSVVVFRAVRASISIESSLCLFGLIREARKEILDFEFCLVLDADMLVVRTISFADIFPGESQELVGVQHFGYRTQNDWQPSERCSAFVPKLERGPTYWQGCLFGGRVDAVLKMADELDEMISVDSSAGTTEGAWEEPYLNWYFNQRSNLVKTLSCSFAAPYAFSRTISSMRRTYEELARGEAPRIIHYNAQTCGVPLGDQ